MGHVNATQSVGPDTRVSKDREQAWLCYILRCADDTFYCGITVDLVKRLAAHGQGTAAKYTRGRGPVELVFMENCADKSAALTGMGDIDAAAEIGGFFNYFVTPQISLTSSLRYGAGNDNKGMVIDLGANYAVQLAPQWRGAVGVATTFANSHTMQSRFGVTPAQAITSGYAAYGPGAGLRDARISASVNHFYSRQIAITAAVSASALLGDAKNSPLVRQNSAVTGVLAVSYEF